MSPPVDFGLADLILKVLEAWELGNRGLYKKYWSYKKIMKISKFYFGPGSPKNRFHDFSGNFLRKNGLEYGITSETTETRDPRVRRRKPGIHEWDAGAVPEVQVCNWVSDRVAPDGESLGTPYARGAVADLDMFKLV